VKGSDKAIVAGVVMAVVLLGFYIKVLSPKRQEASTLSKDVATLNSEIAVQQQTAQFGEAARQEFPAYYGHLVVMGKAVPEQADTPSLLVELSSIADKTNVDFRGISLTSGGSSSSAAAASSTSSTASTSTTSPTSTTPAPSGSSSSTATPAATPTTPAPATEASAASLPLGASVGADNLATMPYDLTFVGSYFDVANFIKSVDDLVHVHGGTQVAADGRLLTIDGFALSSPIGTGPNPKLSVSLAVTSYLTPATEGLTAGASPSGPAPSLTQPQTQPASSTVSP
jgi:Tfp pilus assembly protein PilO